MRRLLAAVGLAGLALLPAGPAAGQGYLAVSEAPAAGVYQGAVDSARALVHAHMTDNDIPGLSIAVGVGGEIVWADGFGFADLENDVGVGPQTKFRIASISKALAAAGVGRLHQEGRLDLDAPVQQYVPSFPEKEHPVTVRQVAGHLAGIRHYRGAEFSSAVQYDDVVDALVIFQDDALQSVPGEEYSYSTYGWNLVSAVVQGAAGRPFLEYMREAVLEPLGMRHTVAGHVDSIIPHRASFYEEDDDRIVNAPFVNNSNKWAGGGYLSTASDMVRYGSSYLSYDILEPATVDLLWTSMRTTTGEETNYGVGWRTGERDGRREVWHTGGAMGGSTVLMIHPEDGVVVSVLTNVSGVGHTGIARAVSELFAQPELLR